MCMCVSIQAYEHAVLVSKVYSAMSKVHNAMYKNYACKMRVQIFMLLPHADTNNVIASGPAPVVGLHDRQHYFVIFHLIIKPLSK